MTVTYTHRPSPRKTAVNAVNSNSKAKQAPTATPTEKKPANQNTPEPMNTSVNALGDNKNPTARKSSNLPSLSPVLNRHLLINPFGYRVPNIGTKVNTWTWTIIFIGVPLMAPFGYVNPTLRAMTTIGLFLRPTIAPSLEVNLGVASLMLIGAIKKVKEIQKGVPVGRSAFVKRRNTPAPL